jgi:hypothetical protein
MDTKTLLTNLRPAIAVIVTDQPERHAGHIVTDAQSPADRLILSGTNGLDLTKSQIAVNLS